MRRVWAAVGLALACLTAVGSIGCVDQKKYDTLKMVNQQLNVQIQEKDAEVIRLQERVSALQARAGDAQKMLEEKDARLADSERQRAEIKKAFDQLLEKYGLIAEGRRPAGPEGRLPEQTKIEIEMLVKEFPGMFEFNRDTGLLRFASDVTFDSGSFVVKPEARQALGKLAAILTADVAKEIAAEIIGHTDTDPVKLARTIASLKEAGKATNNQGLSEARAEAVAALLVAGGVDKARIQTAGKGQNEGIAPNTTPEGKAKNRRVEIYLK